MGLDLKRKIECDNHGVIFERVIDDAMEGIEQAKLHSRIRPECDVSIVDRVEGHNEESGPQKTLEKYR